MSLEYFDSKANIEYLARTIGTLRRDAGVYGPVSLEAIIAAMLNWEGRGDDWMSIDGDPLSTVAAMNKSFLSEFRERLPASVVPAAMPETLDGYRSLDLARPRGVTSTAGAFRRDNLSLVLQRKMHTRHQERSSSGRQTRETVGLQRGYDMSAYLKSESETI